MVRMMQHPSLSKDAFRGGHLCNFQLILQACLHISWKDIKLPLPEATILLDPEAQRKLTPPPPAIRRSTTNRNKAQKPYFTEKQSSIFCSRSTPPAHSPQGHPAQLTAHPQNRRQAGFGRTNRTEFRLWLRKAAAHFQLLSSLQSLMSHA